MKIIYFSQFYMPESIAAAFRATENAEHWVQSGHEVTVFTGFPNYPTGKIFEGYHVNLLSEEHIHGVRVLRSKLIARPNTSIFRRLQNALSFLIYGAWNVLFQQKKIGRDYDVVLGTSGPIFAGLLAWFFAVCHRIPFVFELRDITYRQMMATGDGKMRFPAKVMRFLELFLCKRARQVVVVTNGFREVLTKDGICADKISVITNGVDAAVSKHLNPDGLVLSYFGTLGISQNIMDTMPCAGLLSNLCKNFKYLIIGEGAQRNYIEEEVRKQGLSFVTMMHGMPMKQLEDYYEQTSLSVITLRKSDNFRYTLPSKLFQVMGRGIAVLFIGPEGEAAEIIRANHAGVALTGTPEEDRVTLREFFLQPDWKEQLAVMGHNGAEAVKKHYSRSQLADCYENLLLSAGK